jgi:hypothetical protein
MSKYSKLMLLLLSSSSPSLPPVHMLVDLFVYRASASHRVATSGVILDKSMST